MDCNDSIDCEHAWPQVSGKHIGASAGVDPVSSNVMCAQGVAKRRCLFQLARNTKKRRNLGETWRLKVGTRQAPSCGTLLQTWTLDSRLEGLL